MNDVRNTMLGLSLLVLTGCGLGAPEEKNVAENPSPAVTPKVVAPAETTVTPGPAVPEPTPMPADTETIAAVPEVPKTPSESLPADPEVTNVTEDIQLLRSIAMDRKAKESRLTYADWLEKSQPAQAKLIRTYAEGGSDPELLEKEKKALQKPVADLVGEEGYVSFDGGFIDVIECANATDEKLAGLLQAPTVRELTIQSGKISAKGAVSIASLPNPSRITLYEDVELEEGALEHFGGIPPWTNFECYSEGVDRKKLVALGERRMEMFDKMTDDEKRLAARRYLEGVSYGTLPEGPFKVAQLGQVGITNAQMRFFTALPEIEEIDISEAYELTAEGLKSLKDLKNLRRLELWDTTVASLAPIMHHTTLEVLNVYPEYDTQMGDAGTEGLEKLVNLQEMYLSDGSISDETVKRLAPLVKLKKLELSIDAGLEEETSLAALAGLVELENLSLHGANFGEQGLSYFANLKKLEMLSTRVNNGDGSGFKHLAELPQLRYLYLSGNGVTDKGIQHLAALTNLRTIMAQGAAITSEGARELAAKLPDVTIILDEVVVKSPRESYAMKRRRVQNIASVLIPENWQDDSRSDADGLWVGENGWEKVGGWSGEFVGPASIHLYVRGRKDDENAEKAMMEVVNNNSHLNPKILKKDVVKLDGENEVASCIYRNDHSQSLVCASVLGDQTVSFYCEAPPSRFDEFLPLFQYIARSVHITDDAAQHPEEEVEVSTKELQAIAEQPKSN